MKISIQLAVVAVAACLCMVEAAPESRVGRAKQQRPTRGFKNVEMMTARGFGKRDRPPSRSERDVGHFQTSDRTHRGTPTFKSPSVGIARDFGKRAPEVEPEELPAYRPNSNLRVAVGFGKRNSRLDEIVNEDTNNNFENRKKYKPKTTLMVAPDFGKRGGDNDDNFEEVYGLDNFWEMLESPEKEGSEGNDEKNFESIPLDWFVTEMLNNPEFARAVVRKFIDLNQDDTLTADELLRNMV